MKLLKLFLLYLQMVMLLSACASTERWVGVSGGIETRHGNAWDEPARSTPSLQMKNETLVTGGASLGGRTKPWLWILRGRYNAFVMVSEQKHTQKAVGEFTGSVQQVKFGMDTGLYITDYFYVFLNFFPYTNFVYTKGTKLRPLPGRTTDLGRTWDTGIDGGFGLEYKFSKSLSLGVEYKGFGLIGRALTVDSTGFGYDTDYFSLNLNCWY